MLDLYNMSKARCGDREGFLGAPWPASPAYSESPRPEKERPYFKNKAEGTRGVVPKTGQVHTYTQGTGL